MFSTDKFAPRWTSTSWLAIAEATGVDAKTYSDYLGKAYEWDPCSICLGKINCDGAFVINCGGGSWEAKYLIDPRKKLLFIENIEAFGKGVYIISRIIELGARTGLFDKIELSAGKSGPHIWPRYGFLPAQSEWDSLRTAEHRLNSNLHEIKKSSLDKKALERVSRKIEVLLQDSDPRKIWELAALDELVTFADGRSSRAGVLILSGDASRYYARFSLDSCEQLQVFETYKRMKLNY